MRTSKGLMHEHRLYKHTETTLLEGQNWPVWWIGSKLGNHKKNWGPWDQTISLGTNELGQWEGDQWDEVPMRWEPVTWTFYYHLYLWESFVKITQSVQLNSSSQPLSWENCKGWRIKKMYEYATNCVDLLHIISFSIVIYFLMSFVTLCCVLYLLCVGEVGVFLILSTYEVNKTLDHPLNSRFADIKDVHYVLVHSPCSHELQAYLHLHK